MKRLFGTDGIRGIANEDLTPELAMRVGKASAWALRSNDTPPLIFIGHDTRASSPLLTRALSCGACAVGATVVNLGVLPTPAIAYLTRKHHADAGIVISASHNPFEYNGIKIFNSDGYKLADELEEQIEALVCEREGEIPLAKGDKIGSCVDKSTPDNEYKAEYLKYLRGLCPESLDGLRIGIDCANGALSELAQELFSSLGAKCHMLSSSPNGTNINNGCGSTHMESLCELVRELSLDAGIAFDGDGDRLMAVNEQGEVVDGDMVMASLAYDMKKRGALVKNTVVGTIMTNYGFSVFCKENGISFIPARVGDRYVLEEMLLGGYCFGGEQSGHLIFSDYSTTGDGALSAIMLLSLMKRKSKKLSELHSVIRKYPQEAVNLTASKEQKLLFLTDTKIRELLEEARESLGSRGRVVARPSGTENLIRIMVEGERESEARGVALRLANQISEILDASK